MWTFISPPSTSWAEPPARVRPLRLIRRLGWTVSGLIGVLVLVRLLTGCTGLHCHPTVTLKPTIPAVGMVGMADLGLACERRFP